MKHCFYVLLFGFYFCAAHAQPARVLAKRPKPEAVSATHNSTSRSITTLDYSLNALLWQQRSGEYKALCYQAFALAKWRLDQKLALLKKDSRPLAIVTDIDETVLDNSPQQAHDLLAHTTYTEAAWKNWTSRATAAPLPGAVAFFQYADKTGVQCFYISNRRPEERAATIQNLAAAGFPQADTVHVLLKEGTSDKEPRRQGVNAQYTIALLLGDNLNDFDTMFYNQAADVRCKKVQEASALFGDIFIVLPNPLYGDWESALWNGKKVSPAEADRLKHEALLSY